MKGGVELKSCNEVKELFSDYIDNEIDEKDRKNLEEHVEACMDCKNELEYLKKIVNAVGSLDEVELPGDFKETLHEKLVNQKHKMENKNRLLFINNRYFKAFSSVAAAILVIFMARGLINTNQFMNPYKDTKNVNNSSEFKKENVEYNNSVYDLDDDIAYKNGIAQNPDLGTGSEENKIAAKSAEETPDVQLFARSFSDENQNIATGYGVDGKALERSASAVEPTQDTQVTVTSESVSGGGANTFGATVAAGSADIVIKSASNKKELERLKIIAALCEVELIPIEPEDSNNTVISTGEAGVRLSFKAENQNYARFINELNKNFINNITINDKHEVFNETPDNEMNLTFGSQGISDNSDNKEKTDEVRGTETSSSDKPKPGEEDYITGIIVIE